MAIGVTAIYRTSRIDLISFFIDARELYISNGNYLGSTARNCFLLYSICSLGATFPDYHDPFTMKRVLE
ncbi:hypothetical protein L596_028091 [Steinernema carpocapsae]|uniref:Uncharacterized protein n=1 Tax=Steinernema carpocapsae TaxID=34508 RepID=A0A4U5LXG6_STECR|nr:hypothetical protein L596_028091 [Steinernema carpocapsae]